MNNKMILDGEHKKQVEDITPKIILEVLEQNKPYVNNLEVENYVRFDNTIGEDFSGQAIPLTKELFKDILDTLDGKNTGKNRYYVECCKDSAAVFLLKELLTNSWIPTYSPGCGKCWISYMDLAKDKFQEWKNNNIIVWVEDDGIIDYKDEEQEALDIELEFFFEEILAKMDSSLILNHSSIEDYI